MRDVEDFGEQTLRQREKPAVRWGRGDENRRA